MIKQMTGEQRLQFFKENIPKEPEPILDWLRNSLVLSSVSSSISGSYDVNITPFFKEIYQEFANPDTHTIVLMCGTQVGKSTCMIGCMFYSFSEMPESSILAMPTKEAVKSFVETKVEPVIAISPNIKKIVPNFNLTNKKGSSTLSRWINGYRFDAVTAGTAINRSSRSVARVYIDEVDLIDSHGVSQLSNRLDGFKESKLFIAGTPTIKGQSNIDLQYRQGDQRKYHVPCVKCGTFQELSWDRFIVSREARPYHECLKCKFKHYNEHKDDLVDNGKWVATAEKKGIASFHLSRLYSKFKSWEDVAALQLRANDDWVLQRDFVNHAKAEVWDTELEGKVIYHEGLMGEREEINPEWDIPKEARVLVCGVDIQENRAEGEFIAYGKGYDNRWHIESFIEYGDPREQAVKGGNTLWNKLAKRLGKLFRNEKGHNTRASIVFIDSGFLPEYVAHFCRISPSRHWYPVKGSTKRNMRAILQRHHSRVTGFYIEVNTDLCKGYVYRSLSNNLNKRRTHFPKKDCYNKRYFKMLCSERQVRDVVSKTGEVRYIWVKREGYSENHALDYNVYCEAAYYLYTQIVREDARVNKIKKDETSEEENKRVSETTSDPLSRGIGIDNLKKEGID